MTRLDLAVFGDETTAHATLDAIEARATGRPTLADPDWRHPAADLAHITRDLIDAYTAHAGCLPAHIQARIDELTRAWLPGHIDSCDAIGGDAA